MMTSLDVESHFTNIPLQETIDLCVELLLNDKPNIDGFTKLISRVTCSYYISIISFI